MDFEGSLRSYIEDGIAILGDSLQTDVQHHGNVDISILEAEFDRESEEFINGVTRRVHQIRDEIKSYRPRNVQSIDYEIRLIQYRQFLQSSSISINRLTDWINLLFEQISAILKNILQWILVNSPTIIDVLEQIRDAFKIFIAFLNRH